VIPFASDSLSLGESLPGLDGQVRLPRPAVQSSGRGLKVQRQRLYQVSLRAHLLFRVRDAKSLVQDMIKVDLAPPPVVIVLAMLTTHEEPTVVDLATGSHDRNAGAL
jgi:hypothetical protein